MTASNATGTQPTSARTRHLTVWVLGSLLLLGNVVGWWLALDARSRPNPYRCPIEGPVSPATNGADRLPASERGPAPARSHGPADLNTCLGDPRVQAQLNKRFQEGARLGAAAGSDAARRADIEKAMQRRYLALERRERADRAALERLALDRHLDDATRDRLLEALERQNDDETESFLQWKEGKITDQDHFSDIQSGSARLNEVFTNLVGAEGLTAYKKFWGTEYQKEMDQLDKEEGYP
jgi:hypothetical protein